MPKKLFSSSSGSSKTLSTTRPSPPSSAIPSTFLDDLPVPQLIVYDLDYTLWPFWVDTHVSGPLKPATRDPPYANTHMLDRWGESFTFYPGVPSVLHAARQRGITMSLASRTHAPDLAKDMLRGLYVTPNTQLTAPETDEAVNAATAAAKKGKQEKEKPLRALEYFQYMQIYPGSKTQHFKRIQEATRKTGKEVAFADMLFFDDEARNRNVETELGVTFWLVRDGVSKDEIDKGIWEWRKRRGIGKTDGAGRNRDRESDSEGVAELEG